MSIRSMLLLLAVVAGFTLLAAAQQKEIKHVPIASTSPASGEEMYKTYCAVCHGKDGKGNGPAAEALKAAPSNLTTLAQKNGGQFPADHVASTIRGDVNLPAHGSKDMPIWGNLFWNISQGHSSEVQMRVANLTKYIEGLQAK
jgi:mono/diheme cytochrome c family protein